MYKPVCTSAHTGLDSFPARHKIAVCVTGSIPAWPHLQHTFKLACYDLAGLQNTGGLGLAGTLVLVLFMER